MLIEGIYRLSNRIRKIISMTYKVIVKAQKYNKACHGQAQKYHLAQLPQSIICDFHLLTPDDVPNRV
jgi:hypothetical protein